MKVSFFSGSGKVRPAPPRAQDFRELPTIGAYIVNAL
jgi:hypothetical protein